MGMHWMADDPMNDSLRKQVITALQYRKERIVSALSQISSSSQEKRSMLSFLYQSVIKQYRKSAMICQHINKPDRKEQETWMKSLLQLHKCGLSSSELSIKDTANHMNQEQRDDPSSVTEQTAAKSDMLKLQDSAGIPTASIGDDSFPKVDDSRSKQQVKVLDYVFVPISMTNLSARSLSMDIYLRVLNSADLPVFDVIASAILCPRNAYQETADMNGRCLDSHYQCASSSGVVSILPMNEEAILIVKVDVPIDRIPLEVDKISLQVILSWKNLVIPKLSADNIKKMNQMVAKDPYRAAFEIRTKAIDSW